MSLYIYIYHIREKDKLFKRTYSSIDRSLQFTTLLGFVTSSPGIEVSRLTSIPCIRNSCSFRKYRGGRGSQVTAAPRSASIFLLRALFRGPSLRSSILVRLLKHEQSPPERRAPWTTKVEKRGKGRGEGRARTWRLFIRGPR